MQRAMVSAIIPMFNAESYIAETIESVNSQTYPNVEIVVVDDGSTDASYTLVQELVLTSRFPITLINQVNSGVSASRNRGVESSRGELIAFLDSDDLWKPSKLVKQLNLLATCPDAVGVMCAYEQFDSKSRNVVSQIVPSCTEKFMRDWLSLRGPGPLLPSTLLMKRSVWDQAQGFDERLSTAADADYGFRLFQRGPLLVIPEPLTCYRLSEGQMHRDPVTLESDYELILLAPYLHSDRQLRAEMYSNLRLHISLKRWKSNREVIPLLKLISICLRYPVRASQRVLRRIQSMNHKGDSKARVTLV